MKKVFVALMLVSFATTLSACKLDFREMPGGGNTPTQQTN